jgi:hypothetical protein
MTDVLTRRWAEDGIWSGIRRTLRDPGDVDLAIRIGLFITLLPRKLASRPLDSLLAEISRTSRARIIHSDDAVARIARIRQAWLASPMLRSSNTCYVRAITTFRFLDARQHKMRIHVGVEPGVSATDRLRGHAWVTVDGCLLEAPDPVIAGRVRELYAYAPA